MPNAKHILINNNISLENRKLVFCIKTKTLVQTAPYIQLYGHDREQQTRIYNSRCVSISIIYVNDV